MTLAAIETASPAAFLAGTAVAAGVATTHFGLHQTAAIYSAVLAVLAAAAAGSFLFRRRSQTRGSDPAAARAGRTG